MFQNKQVTELSKIFHQQEMQEIKIKSSKWEKELPKPPIPSLSDTLKKYLINLKSILSFTQYLRLEESVKKFIDSSDSKQLQKLLEIYANNKVNWITQLWLDDMYLRNQVPLPVNSNAAFLLPKQKFEDYKDMLWFAANFIQFTINFNEKIKSEQLEQDVFVLRKTNVIKSDKNNNVEKTVVASKKPLCMQTYKHFFNAYRKPGIDKDELILNQDNCNQHIVVACHDQFFAISYDFNNENESLINYLYKNLLSIWEFCKRLNNNKDENSKKLKQQPVGFYTTEHRRIWWSIRNNLLKKTENLQSLTCIEKCLFVLCLDDIGKKIYKNELSESDQLSRLLHGEQKYSSNRWFDKFLNAIIGTDGVFGLLMEHSGSEGLTIIRFAESFLSYWNEIKNKHPILSDENNNQLIRTFSKNNSIDKLVLPGQVIHLQWKLDKFDLEKLNEAKEHLESLIDGVDLCVNHYKNYGRQWIKQQNISPDCFFQLALQVTFYKMHGKLTSSYESAGLRRFREGRVDNIRANTLEALLLARALCGELPNTTKQQLVCYLKDAIKKQTNIMEETISGYGIDNHLLGIREMAMRHQNLLKRSNSESSNNTQASKNIQIENLPEIFTSYAFKQFVNFQLTTSQVNSEKGIVTGYGAVVRNGFGCCYNILPDQINIMVSSFLGGYDVNTNTYNNYNSNYGCTDTNISRSELFSQVLNQTLTDLKDLIVNEKELYLKN